MFDDVIVFLIIAAFVAVSLAKISRDKKTGSRCAGCPLNKVCARKEERKEESE
ncbi:attachment p12 family protein [Trichococcus patagoniensis]|uniref:Attachment p12 family protein n=1 Tax=Trichococcus patagoniensis TaxID=382641 RepID=A0A2T5IQ17_9LACT|nr:FeoB-associated Cys-rich membrane protein [Trichococcus patagoniensis]PTQ85916.1 attachment p12 family protein [Trichococcus patagoniensis]